MTLEQRILEKLSKMLGTKGQEEADRKGMAAAADTLAALCRKEGREQAAKNYEQAAKEMGLPEPRIREGWKE